MRILLLGNTGQLGWELERALAPLGEVTALDYPELNLADEGRVRLVVRRGAPQVIVNATAYTAVDRAETEPDLAMAINARAPAILAEEARRLGAALIHFSTDYVFDGTKGAPYVESDTPHPLGVYGQSKLAGEQAIQQIGGAYLILRTAWVYSLRRDSFVTKVLQWARQQRTLRLATDQVSNPTWARMLAEATAQLLAMGNAPSLPPSGSPRTQRTGTGGESAAPSPISALEMGEGWGGGRAGLYHLAGDGYASRFEWAQAILRLDPRREEQVVEEIQPALSTDFPTPARRPLFSALNCDKFAATFGLRLPPWEDALRLAMER